MRVNTQRDMGVSSSYKRMHRVISDCLCDLGNGFVVNSSPLNVNIQGLYEELIRLVYRLLSLEIRGKGRFFRAVEDVGKEYFSLLHFVDCRPQESVSMWSFLCRCMKQMSVRIHEETGCSVQKRLWNDDLFPQLMAASCPDIVLEGAIRSLVRFVQEETPTSLHLGKVYELLLSYTPTIDAGVFILSIQKDSTRKTTGAHYTPKKIVECVLNRTLKPLIEHAKRGRDQEEQEIEILNLRVCDPTCGSGLFLLEVTNLIAEELINIRSVEQSEVSRPDAFLDVLCSCIYGVDINPLSVDVCILLMWMVVDMNPEALKSLEQHICHGHGLLGGEELASAPEQIANFALQLRNRYHFFDWEKSFYDVFTGEKSGFDAVVGNPPWMSYSGRHAHSISIEEKKVYQYVYKGFSGWLALHSLFVERSLRLTRERGIIGLVLPQQLAHLVGYTQIRDVVRQLSVPQEPMPNFGEWVFEGVEQPSFALITQKRVCQGSSGHPFSLASQDIYIDIITDMMTRLRAHPKPPKEMFRDIGVHTGNCAKSLITKEKREGDVPVYEGKDVFPFQLGPPQTWLKCGYKKKKGEYYTIRKMEEYTKVRILIRQTASRPIACTHLPKHYFRNSILACYGHSLCSDHVLVAWLNSTAVAFFHLNSISDSQQKVFPQVKIAHLRNLPILLHSFSELEGVEDRVDERISRALGFSKNEHALLVLLYKFQQKKAQLDELARKVQKTKREKTRKSYELVYEEIEEIQEQISILNVLKSE